MDSNDSERSDEVGHKDSGHSVTNVSRSIQSSVETQGAVALPEETINDQLSQDTELAQLIGNLCLDAEDKEWLHRVNDAQRIFVKTTGYQHVCDTLDHFGHVLITGSPGSGKTTMTFRIMGNYLKKKFKVKFFESASDFNPKLISQHFPTLLVFDDIFGYFSPAMKEVVHCKNVFDYLKTRFKRLEEEQQRGRTEEEEGYTAGDLPFKVLMNSRTNVWEMVKKIFLEHKTSLFRESAIADLTTLTKLFDKEKEKILKKHLSVRKCETLSSDDIKAIASLDYSSLGFPHLCELFGDSDCPKDKIFEFFQKPMMYLVGMIEKIFYQSEERACVLLLMILNDGVLRLLDLQDPDDREASGLNAKLALCREIIRNVPTPSDISEAAKQEKNSLLISVGDTMKFSHPTIHDAVAFVVGSKNPLFVLQHCSLQFITERTEIDEKRGSQSGDDDTNFKILLTAAAGRYLLKRLAEEIVDGDYALALSHQCLMSEHLVDNLFEQLSKEDETHTYLHAPDKRYKQGFLFWLSFICMGPVTERCFKLTEFNCHEILEGCFGCCMSGNTRSFQALVSHSPSFYDAIVSSTLASILESQSETSLSSASPTKPNTPDEKETVRMHGNNRDMLIHIAAANGFDTIVKILLDLGCHIDAVGGNEMTALMYACYLGQVELVKNLVSLGADPLLLDEEGDNCLHLACRGGSMTIVQYLLDKDMDVNERGKYERTPLIFAAYNGHEEIVRFLLQKGAIQELDLTLVKNKDNALHLACAKGHTDIVKVLLEEGINIEVQGEKKQTPIMYACRHGHLETAQVLNERGAKLDISDETNYTCLHLVSICGSLETAEWILGVLGESALDSVSSKGRTPLMMAFQYGQSNMIEFLLSRGADVTCRDDFNLSCLHAACRGGSLEIVKKLMTLKFDIEEEDVNGMTPLAHAVKCDNVEVIEYLVLEGADVHKTVPGRSYLHSAARNGSTKSCKKLLDFGINVDVTDHNDKTPLMYAAENGHEEIVKFLLQKGADVTCRDDFNLSCLHAACRGGSLEIVKKLMTLKFDIEEEDVNGMTPLAHAVKCDNVEVMEYLVQEGADVHKTVTGRSYLHFAASAKSPNMYIANQLLNLGLDINALDDSNKTPVMYAVFTRHGPSVDFLLSKGCSLSTMDQRGMNSTLLHFACCMKDMATEIPQILLGRGIDIDARDGNNKTPVMCAVNKNNLALMRFLLSKGCSLNTYIRRGVPNTLLHYACSMNNVGTEIIDMLVSYGISLNARNSYHQTPVMCAARQGNQTLVEHLRSLGADM